MVQPLIGKIESPSVLTTEYKGRIDYRGIERCPLMLSLLFIFCLPSPCITHPSDNPEKGFLLGVEDLVKVRRRRRQALAPLPPYPMSHYSFPSHRDTVGFVVFVEMAIASIVLSYSPI